jgi:hypothetical protein
MQDLKQSSRHPSPELIFPSSQTSSDSTMPFPHTPGTIVGGGVDVIVGAGVVGGSTVGVIDGCVVGPGVEGGMVGRGSVPT